MKNHVWRPLFLVVIIVAGILVARTVLVPDDFGVFDRGYMYGWHRLSNEAEWKTVRLKYKTSQGCKDCHSAQYNDIRKSVHSAISCENCHGPSYEHPLDPVGLNIDRSRGLCIRCHAQLSYDNARGTIPGIDPATHYPQAECIMCHYPHNPARPNPKHRKPEVTP